MRKSRFTESQIVAVLKEAESGVPVNEVCRKHGISDATYYNWKSKYGGMEVSGINRKTLTFLVENTIKRYDAEVPSRLCKYFGCYVCDFLEYVKD